MDMKKKLLLSMILLALCLIQASASTYYFKIKYYDKEGNLRDWSNYIRVDARQIGTDTKTGKPIYDYPNGLRTLLNGGQVKDDENPQNTYELPKTGDNKGDKTKIYGIEFANGKGRGITTSDGKQEENILEGDEYSAWTEIREHIKYLGLGKYIRNTYPGDTYFGNMHQVEKLELPQCGIIVGNGVDEKNYMYFCNADNLKEITIWNGTASVDITNYANPVLQNCVGEYMFSNCFNLSTKYINRLIKDVTEIKDNAFYADEGNRGKFPDDADHKIAIEIPSSVTKIGNQAFLNRVKVTGLNIQGNSLDIGSEAFKGCDALAKISLTQDNTKLQIHDNAFESCIQLNDFESMNKAQITDLGTGVFRNCQSMTNDFVNGVLTNYAANGGTKIPAYLFFGCNGQNFTQLDIPASFTQIDKGAFAKNSNVTEITVHSGTQIDAQTYNGEDGIFYEMIPNKVQVVFEGKAETKYTVYRDNIKVDGEDKGPNAFMYLLTKTLDENDEDYTLVAQRHADVRLYRTFKPGWNTLVLPFGARVIENREVDAAEIFQKALNATETPGFMIAAYRGLAKNELHPDNSTFYFLKYANIQSDPLDEFEPLLIRMTKEDIDDANGKGGVYTFKDVELNYDGDNNTTYTAKGAKDRMGKKENGNFFDGNYNHEDNDKFKKCSYDDFYFTGTLYKQDAHKNPAFIVPGDYIIQNNTFVKCLSDKKYGLKGFRGYFKQKPSSTSTSPAKGIGICLVDRNGVVSSIHQVDGVSLTPASVAPAAVYNLSGQQVGNSLSTLAKGVYIVKGKKFVKK